MIYAQINGFRGSIEQNPAESVQENIDNHRKNSIFRRAKGDFRRELALHHKQTDDDRKNDQGQYGGAVRRQRDAVMQQRPRGGTIPESFIVQTFRKSCEKITAGMLSTSRQRHA